MSKPLRPKKGKFWHDRREWERDYLVFHICENDKSITRTAKSLGMDRSHLYGLIKVHQIEVREL